MGVLVNGKWTDGELAQETGERGQFQRVESRFRERITADGSSGFKAEPGRYHLYVSHGCPWAHRTLIYKCNKKRIANYSNLSNYVRELYSVPGVEATTKPRYYAINYYSMLKLNPTEIIPKGTPVDLGQPLDRARIAA